jgi:hypothetical protein
VTRRLLPCSERESRSAALPPSAERIRQRTADLTRRLFHAHAAGKHRVAAAAAVAIPPRSRGPAWRRGRCGASSKVFGDRPTWRAAQRGRDQGRTRGPDLAMIGTGCTQLVGACPAEPARAGPRLARRCNAAVAGLGGATTAPRLDALQPCAWYQRRSVSRCSVRSSVSWYLAVIAARSTGARTPSAHVGSAATRDRARRCNYIGRRRSRRSSSDKQAASLLWPRDSNTAGHGPRAVPGRARASTATVPTSCLRTACSSCQLLRGLAIGGNWPARDCTRACVQL